MNLTGILADLYRRLNFTTTPPAATTTRLTAFINEAHRQILSRPGMEGLRDNVIAFGSTAGVARYGLPPVISRVKDIGDQANMRRLRYLALDQFRTLDPGVTASGTPDWWIPVGYQAAPVQQPIAQTGLWAVSASAADTTQTVFVETVRLGGYRSSASVTLNGLTRVQLGTLTDHTEVVKFYLSATAVGFVSLFTAAAAGTELARIEIGKTYARYYVVQLYPTPSAAVTYYCDYMRVISDMVNGTDEPLLPEDFHYLLVTGALRREYQKSDDSRWLQTVKDEEIDGLKALRNWVLYPPDFDAIPGRLPVGRPILAGISHAAGVTGEVMGIKDPHDPRPFQQYVKFAADGTVAAIVEVADGQPDPDDQAESVYVNVTDLHPIEVSRITVSPADVVAARTSGRASQPPPGNGVVIVPVPPVAMTDRARTARRALRVALEAAKETQRRG